MYHSNANFFKGLILEVEISGERWKIMGDFVINHIVYMGACVMLFNELGDSL